jgi:hypothetical protein
VLLRRSCPAGFNGIYLVRFAFRMREILAFKLKIQINLKTTFSKEKSVEEW